MEDILEKLKRITNEKNIFINEPMNTHTSFRTGGVADFFVEPENEDELINLMHLEINKTIIGNGSNVLVTDKGIRGLVISTKNMKNIFVNDTIIVAECGASLSKVASVARDHSLTGFEFASGIPGSMRWGRVNECWSIW